MKIPRLLREAAKVAASGSPDRNYYVGCIAKRADGALVQSCNGKNIEQTPDIHAEARVLRKAGYGATLYVARVTRETSEWRKAKPCKTCQIIIRNRNVVKVYYTISESEYGVWIPE